MVKKSQQCDVNLLYLWKNWAQSYFCASLIICDKAIDLIIDREENKNILNSLSYKYGCPLLGQYLLMPIIYNFMHGTELYLKYLGNLVDQQYENNHNLLDLLNKLINKIDKSEYIKKKIEVIYDKLNETRDLIKKYQNLLYLGKDSIFDKDNQANRYPETKITFSYPQIFNDKTESFVTVEYLHKIKKDIKNLFNTFKQFQVIFDMDNRKIRLECKKT